MDLADHELLQQRQFNSTVHSNSQPQPRRTRIS